MRMFWFAIAALSCTSVVSQSKSPFGQRVGPTFDLVKCCGALGDNATLNTRAFEQAVAKVRQAGGGTLYVPDGTFITAPFNFTSHMTLYLSGKAVIRGPTPTQLGPSPTFPLWPLIEPMPSYGQGRDHPGYRRTSLLHGEHLEDVTVTADEEAWGTIDGYGSPWWEAHNSGTETITRGHLIEFMHTKGIEISNLYLRNSPFWTVHPVYSSNIVVRNIDIWAPKDSPNTDGVDPESSSNVLIENFSYHGGDDVIAIKSGWDCAGYKYNMSCSNIMIRNVTAIFSRAAGVAIGSEMSGGMNNITVQDCDFRQVNKGLNIKYSKYRGGYVKDIRFSNIAMGNISGGALVINSGFGSSNSFCQPPVIVPCPVSGVTYTNITQATGTTCSSMIDFKGLESNTITGVMIEDVHLNFDQPFSNCELVQGQFLNAPGAEKCTLLRKKKNT